MSGPDQTLRWYVCGFFDVLGQRDRLRQLRVLPKNEQEMREAAETMQGTVEFVRSLRRTFREYFDIVAKPRMDVSALSAEQQQVYRESRELELRLMGFSDCFIVWISMKGCQTKAAPMVGIWATLYGAAATMLLSLYQGHALRGGIDIGLGTEIEPGEIYGPAALKAYELESKCAEYPRIVVGQALHAFLSTMASGKADSLHSRISKKTCEDSLQFIVQDEDGQFMLDFAGTAVKSVSGSAVGSQVVKQGFDFVKSEHERFLKEGNAVLAARYARLRKYLEGRLILW